MDFEDYKKKGVKLYEDFSGLIRQCIKEEIEKRKDLPKLQFSKHRGKTAKSLQIKLAGRNTNVEKEVKDLAGVRLVFYTNTDVSRFLGSGLIHETFQVYSEKTRIHYPTKEEDESYQGIHHIVSLRPKLAKLPRYKKFSGLRCEIQIQTTLNNAWSDTNHAVGYKTPCSDGFGKKAREAMNRQMDEIMDKHLKRNLFRRFFDDDFGGCKIYYRSVG